jgi:hypothetical protein
VVAPNNCGDSENAAEVFLLLLKYRVLMKTAVVAICPAGYSSQYGETVVTRSTIKGSLKFAFRG